MNTIAAWRHLESFQVVRTCCREPGRDGRKVDGVLFSVYGHVKASANQFDPRYFVVFLHLRLA